MALADTMCWIGICFPLFQVSSLVLEASSQRDEGTWAVPGSSHAGYGTIRTTLKYCLWSCAFLQLTFGNMWQKRLLSRLEKLYYIF